MTDQTGPGAAEGSARTIVVGVDGSEGSRRALGWALREAQQHEATVRAVAVWEDPFSLIGPPPPVRYGGDVTKALERMLAEVVAEAEVAAGPPAVVIRRDVRSGQAAEVLTALARPGDLLVVGSRGLGGIQRLLLGSVSQRCALLATAPVVIVPTPHPAHPAHPA